ncbi:MAG TPA: metallophosphoesterase [Agriterribacter sp.]|nr:metallophosphoesterase [Agriterribacter sp.]HRQ52002.1 metallophosphoesterase [Agriterribacter sp.]
MSSINRRSFITQTSLGAGAALGLPALPSLAAPQKDPWQCVHNTDTMQTIISLTGLQKAVTVLQVADTHISCDNESDREYEQYSARMNRAFLQPKHYKTGEPTTTMACFKDIMEMAKQEKVDLIALVGDIVNYPSATAVEFVRSTVEATGIPHIYTAGNHDWHYEGMKGSSDELRRNWCEKRLKPLYTGKHLFYSSDITGGINMVTIDNSTYQVNEEQLAFFRDQLKRPEPIALFVHIPLYMQSMRMCCGHPEWGAGNDKNYEIERRERWSAAGNAASTKAFVKEVMTAKKLTGVFAGHWHRYYSISQRQVHQHLALPGFSGQYRMIRFQPLV